MRQLMFGSLLSTSPYTTHMHMNTHGHVGTSLMAMHDIGYA